MISRRPYFIVSLWPTDFKSISWNQNNEQKPCSEWAAITGMRPTTISLVKSHPNLGTTGSVSGIDEPVFCFWFYRLKNDIIFWVSRYVSGSCTRIHLFSLYIFISRVLVTRRNSNSNKITESIFKLNNKWATPILIYHIPEWWTRDNSVLRD